MKVPRLLQNGESALESKTGLRVLLVHLNDDYSGAAKVLAGVGIALLEAGFRVSALVGSRGGSGFIRDSLPFVEYPYTFGGSRLRMLLGLLAAQWRLFWRVRRTCRRGEVDLVYVNAVMPAAAAVAAFLSGVPVVTHIHEVGMTSRLLFGLLYRTVRTFSERLICVSKYVQESLRVPASKALILYNTLSSSEWAAANEIAQSRSKRQRTPFVVAMVCSLKWYKGIDSFLQLAELSEAAADDFEFRLIVNAELEELHAFMASCSIPQRVRVICRPQSVFAHYAETSVLLNLSHPEDCIETFGLTLLEAMACGIPVIAPQVGGCTELFLDGLGGWRHSSRDITGILNRIRALRNDPDLWRAASDQARLAAAKFDLDSHRRKLVSLLYHQISGPESRLDLSQ